MKTFKLHDHVIFGNKEEGHAEPLLVTKEQRVLRFALRPGQYIAEHDAPNSPVQIVIMRGSGMFTGPDGEEKRYSAGECLVFDSAEKHSIRALDEDLVFVAFLHGVSTMDEH